MKPSFRAQLTRLEMMVTDLNEGQLKAIWIKRVRRGTMDAADSVELIAGRGIADNADQGGRRQVTILEQRVWNNLMKQFDSNLPPSVRRANLMVEGIDLTNTSGRILRIGSCRILVSGETKPCERLDQSLPGLKAAMEGNWAGGAFGEVLDSGQISVGDLVRWED